ncbi:unnamed protein product [Effrenium voratum]|uniref:PNPLA domain-containing protein n=1 Tax=Effrenium voratum TaxID=2562239 RepID=A0AA36IXR6_9DINO|nr:unnamed protein product [Effrenium voratum]CAJ1449980.1 unnamed protein product [Effrenium voratum]
METESSDGEDGVASCSWAKVALLEEDSDWESFVKLREDGEKIASLDVVCHHEHLFLQTNRKRTRDADDSDSAPRLALAFSGGGVRSAFVAAGVLWRLAEVGRLKDVDYISGVSGGTYAATAFASHVLAETSSLGAGPPALDDFYRRAVAKMVDRMQHNTPYLSRDLGQEVPPETQRGSGFLPRFCDIPQLVVLVLATVLRAPCALACLLVLPTVEVIELLYGSDMRSEFCRDVFSSRKLVLGVFGFSTTQRQAEIFLGILFTVFMVHMAQGVLKQHMVQRSDAGFKRALCWTFLRSCLAVLVRLLALWVMLTAFIEGPVAWRLQRYSSVLGGNELRFCQCAKFIREGAAASTCGEVLLGSHESPTLQQRWGIYLNSTAADCQEVFSSAGESSEDLVSRAEGWLLHRPLGETFLPVFLLFLVSGLFLAVLLLPIIPEFFVGVFNLFVPVLLLSLTFFLVQFRVLSPITQEKYFSLHLNSRLWARAMQCCLFLAIVGLGFSRFFRTFTHRYYSRSLHRAFYAGGKNCTWSQVRRNPYCPMFLLGATANDYLQVGDGEPSSYVTFSQLHAGGSRLGYFWAYGRRPLARTAALSGGAIDGFIMAKNDSLSLRFWLEALGFFMGDFVRVGRQRKEWTRLEQVLSLLAIELGYVCLFFAISLAVPPADLGSCKTARRLALAAALQALIVTGLSFFSFLPCLGWMQRSPYVRTLQQATRFYYQSPSPPRSVYISDGGVMENSGILALMQRRCKRILAVYAGEEKKGKELNCLHKLLSKMHEEDIGYLFDLSEPRRGPLHTLKECGESGESFLELGIFYHNDPETGILTLVRNKVPPDWDQPVLQHLSEEEVMGLADPELDLTLPLKQTKLGGCCCDCCHRHCCNRCMGRFPTPPTANQFLTPQMFNSLCRLGRELVPFSVAQRL